MRHFAVVLFASAFPFLAAAQQPAPTQAQPQQGQAPEPPKKARIEGLVVSLAGQPVGRAQVRLTGPISVQNGALTPGAAFSITTDDAGKFAIENIEPARNYQLMVQKTGFVNGRYGARSANSAAAPLSLEAGQSLKGVTITLTPQGVVSGRVLDSNGDPIQNARVAVMRRGYQRGVRQLMQSGGVSTNDQGDYRAANLAPGRYYLMVQGPPTAIATAGAPAQRGAIPTYYPNAVDETGAAPLDVAAGQEVRGIDVRLHEDRVYTVRGKVVGINGAPVATAMILPTPKGAGDNVQVLINAISSPGRSAADGSFEVRGLRPGTYSLQALPQTSGALRASGRLDVNIVDSDVADLVVSVTPGPTVTGTVRLEDGDIKKLLGPADPNPSTSAATVVAATNAGIAINGARMTVGLTDLVPALLSGSSSASVKEDGTFALEGVAPSKYQLNVAALPQGVYVKSARLGGSDVTHTTLDLTSGPGGNLEIVLSNKAADITGVVQSDNNDSLAGVMVSLWTRDPDGGSNTNGVKTATTDQNGSFTFAGLRPGVYYAAAWEDIDSGLAQARDLLGLFTNDATKLDLGDGAHAATQVKVIPVAKIKAAEEKLP